MNRILPMIAAAAFAVLLVASCGGTTEPEFPKGRIGDAMSRSDFAVMTTVHVESQGAQDVIDPTCSRATCRAKGEMDYRFTVGDLLPYFDLVLGPGRRDDVALFHIDHKGVWKSHGAWMDHSTFMPTSSGSRTDDVPYGRQEAILRAPGPCRRPRGKG